MKDELRTVKQKREANRGSERDETHAKCVVEE